MMTYYALAYNQHISRNEIMFRKMYRMSSTRRETHLLEAGVEGLGRLGEEGQCSD